MAQTRQSTCVFSGVGRVVAVGDLHGNHAGFLRILEETGLVDGDGRWQARDTHLVQLGDVLGRGGEPGKIFALIRRLEDEAPAFGSRVHMLLGNHEAMSVRGILRYNTLEEFRDFAEAGFLSDFPPDAIGGAAEPAESWVPAEAPRAKFERRLDAMGAKAFHAAVAPTGPVGAWLVGHASAIAIDGNLFVHGGLNRAHGLMPLEELNAFVREGLLLSGDEGAERIRRDGPQWDRGYLLRPGASKREELDGVLEYHGCRRMVVGHTPTSCLEPEHAGSIASAYDGRLYAIDTGIGLAYGGRLSALVLEDGEVRTRYF